MELYSDVHPFNLPLRISRFETETHFTKFIKNCEMLIRRSSEYKDWKSYIIDILGINSCMITDERMDQVSIEVHHHIPSLFILVKGLVNEKLYNKETFCSFDIATKAIELHFQNKVGYITIIKSLHEKFHNGFLGIPKSFVKGDYMYFIKEYSEFLDDEDLDIVNFRSVRSIEEFIELKINA